MHYQWLYSCFREDKRPSIRLHAAGLCHFILGKLPRKWKAIPRKVFRNYSHYWKVWKKPNDGVYPRAAHT